MPDPAKEFDHDGKYVTWRLRRSEGQILEAMDKHIVLELVTAHGATLASISIPPDLMVELLRPHLSIFAELQLDGSVSLDSELFALFPPEGPPDILELVKHALAPEMLQDEPNLKDQLHELRRKLTDSLTLVDKALADLCNPEP